MAAHGRETIYVINDQRHFFQQVPEDTNRWFASTVCSLRLRTRNIPKHVQRIAIQPLNLIRLMLSQEEVEVLRDSSIINGKCFLPWVDQDLQVGGLSVALYIA